MDPLHMNLSMQLKWKYLYSRNSQAKTEFTFARTFQHPTQLKRPPLSLLILKAQFPRMAQVNHEGSQSYLFTIYLLFIYFLTVNIVEIQDRLPGVSCAILRCFGKSHYCVVENMNTLKLYHYMHLVARKHFFK